MKIKIIELEQENKQLKDKINNYKQENKELKANKNLNHVQKRDIERLTLTCNKLVHSDEILKELEEYLDDSKNWYIDLVHTGLIKEPFIKVDNLKDKIQMLKEKYK